MGRLTSNVSVRAQFKFRWFAIAGMFGHYLLSRLIRNLQSIARKCTQTKRKSKLCFCHTLLVLCPLQELDASGNRHLVFCFPTVVSQFTYFCKYTFCVLILSRVVLSQITPCHFALTRGNLFFFLTAFICYCLF